MTSPQQLYQQQLQQQQQQYQQYQQQQYQQQPQQIQQQQYQQRQLDPQRIIEIDNYYKHIFNKLQEIMQTTEGNTHVDKYKLIEYLGAKPIPQDKMNYLFKHLLKYTYQAEATEIANHEEINKQLVDIRAALAKILKEDKTVETADTEPKKTD
jgi:hypothetical protein